jgi:hypothetical protein
VLLDRLDYAPGKSRIVLPHARRVCRLANRGDISPIQIMLGCNQADCFCAGGAGVFRATSRANLSAFNRVVFSRVAKPAASYSAIAF